MQQDFDQVIAQYGKLLARVAASYEANDALQQELFQEIGLAVWQALRRYDSKSSVKTYVLRVAHNRAISHVTAQVKLARTENYDSVQERHYEQSIEPLSSELIIANQRSTVSLLEAVRQLPLGTRQVVALSLEGLSYKDIAEICGLTTSHVGVVLTRAKNQILQLMESHDE